MKTHREKVLVLAFFAVLVSLLFIAAVCGPSWVHDAPIDAVLEDPIRYADKSPLTRYFENWFGFERRPLLVRSTDVSLVEPQTFAGGLAASVEAAKKQMEERGIRGVTGVPARTTGGRDIRLYLHLENDGLVKKVHDLCTSDVSQVTIVYTVLVVGRIVDVLLVDIKAQEG